MARYFTSDLHFGHTRIVELAYRPYTSVDEMNEDLIDRWNATVTPDDEVWVIGDLVMGHRNDNLPLVGRLNGTIMLVPGNHDHVHPMHERQRPRWTPEYEQYVQITDPAFTTDIGGNPVQVSHFPYDGDHTDDERYLDQRPTDHGLPLIHGHVHGEWLVRNSRQGTPMLNVGVDVHDYVPIHEDEVAFLLGLSA